MLQCVAVCCSELTVETLYQGVFHLCFLLLLYCVLQCVAVCCRVLQCVVVCRRVLQCVVV